jgi:hypothetical protein
MIETAIVTTNPKNIELCCPLGIHGHRVPFARIGKTTGREPLHFEIYPHALSKVCDDPKQMRSFTVKCLQDAFHFTRARLSIGISWYRCLTCGPAPIRMS